jgi:hypothetical protein
MNKKKEKEKEIHRWSGWWEADTREVDATQRAHTRTHGCRVRSAKKTPKAAAAGGGREREAAEMAPAVGHNGGGALQERRRPAILRARFENQWRR